MKSIKSESDKSFSQAGKIRFLCGLQTILTTEFDSEIANLDWEKILTDYNATVCSVISFVTLITMHFCIYI